MLDTVMSLPRTPQIPHRRYSATASWDFGSASIAYRFDAAISSAPRIQQFGGTNSALVAKRIAMPTENREGCTLVRPDGPSLHRQPEKGPVE